MRAMLLNNKIHNRHVRFNHFVYRNAYLDFFFLPHKQLKVWALRTNYIQVMPQLRKSYIRFKLRKPKEASMYIYIYT